jgi:hypothetical protein
MCVVLVSAFVLYLPSQSPFIVNPTGELVLAIVTHPYHLFTDSRTKSQEAAGETMGGTQRADAGEGVG